jgi:hypothetical protein
MKVLKWIAIVVVVLIVLFVVVGLLLPSEIDVERSVVVNTEPERVHRLVGDLTAWDDWTPFNEMDETIEVTYGDKTSGVGASQTWTDKSGGGELTITEWDPEGGIAYDVSFAGTAPMTSVMRYEVVADGTRVTWDLKGDIPGVMGGYLALVIPAGVGPMYDMGLQKLKAQAEALEPLPVVPEEIIEAEIVEE